MDTINLSAAEQIVHDTIERLALESHEEYSQYCKNLKNADFIVNWLKEHGVERREDVINLFTKLEGNSITLLIAYRISIEKKPQLSKSVHDYIVKLSENIERVQTEHPTLPPFDLLCVSTSAFHETGFLNDMEKFTTPETERIATYIDLDLSHFKSLGERISDVFANIGGRKRDKNEVAETVRCYMVRMQNLGLLKVQEGENLITSHWQKLNAAFMESSQKISNEWQKYIANLKIE